MKVALEDFTWRRPDGLALDKHSSDPKKHRIIASSFGKPYAPFREVTGLFRIFLATDPTEEGMIGFVADYGFPHYGQKFGDINSGDNDPDNDFLWERKSELIAEEMEEDPDGGEESSLSFGDFLYQRGELQFAARMAEALKTENVDEAMAICELEINRPEGSEGGHFYKQLQASSASGVKKEMMAFLKRTFRSFIHDKLQTLGCGVSLQPTLGDGWQLVFRPRSLHSAMWLQFCLSIAENTQFKNCEHCSNPFALGGKRSKHQARPDKKYCSISCRVRAYQKRKDDAAKKPEATKKTKSTTTKKRKRKHS